jgi:hypothetical protein
MSSQSPVPILTYGRRTATASAVKAGLAPEYDGAYLHVCLHKAELRIELPVVHIILTEEAAQAEFPKVLAGDLKEDPASGLGSNVQRKVDERIVPKIVVCGGEYVIHVNSNTNNGSKYLV